nr:hypothetical protein [Bradyrhizobium cosmicum]
MVTPTEVTDHVEPHKGDRVRFWDRAMWQPACAWHHDVVKQKLEVMFAKGEILVADLWLDSRVAVRLTLAELPVGVGAARSTVFTSGAVELNGFTAPAAISIAGGTYSVNGGGFTSSPGTVAPYDQVQVRLTSSAAGATQVTATLTVGGVNGAYSVTTA